MECPTCGSDMVLMRTVTQDETYSLNKRGAASDEPVDIDVYHVDAEQFICTTDSTNHLFAAEWDDEAEVYKFKEAK